MVCGNGLTQIVLIQSQNSIKEIGQSVLFRSRFIKPQNQTVCRLHYKRRQRETVCYIRQLSVAYMCDQSAVAVSGVDIQKYMWQYRFSRFSA